MRRDSVSGLYEQSRLESHQGVHGIVVSNTPQILGGGLTCGGVPGSGSDYGIEVMSPSCSGGRHKCGVSSVTALGLSRLTHETCVRQGTIVLTRTMDTYRKVDHCS